MSTNTVPRINTPNGNVLYLTSGEVIQLENALGTNASQIVMEDDSARTRRTDPVTSHRAADRSQKNLHATKFAVLTLIHQEGYLSGEELNDLYSIRTPGPDWPKAKFDTPRKKAGELCRDGYLMNVADPDDDWATYCLTARGLNAIGADE